MKLTVLYIQGIILDKYKHSHVYTRVTYTSRSDWNAIIQPEGGGGWFYFASVYLTQLFIIISILFYSNLNTVVKYNTIFLISLFIEIPDRFKPFFVYYLLPSAIACFSSSRVYCSELIFPSIINCLLYLCFLVRVFFISIFIRPSLTAAVARAVFYFYISVLRFPVVVILRSAPACCVGFIQHEPSYPSFRR